MSLDPRDEAFAVLTGKVLGMEMALQSAVAMLLMLSVKDPLMAGETGKLAVEMSDRLKGEVVTRVKVFGNLHPVAAEAVTREALRAIEGCFGSTADLLETMAKISLDLATPKGEPQN